MSLTKSLNNRERGYEFSATEYDLIFENEDIGFVRYDKRSRRRFYLDPSPFLKTPKNEVYVIENGDFPKEGECVKVASYESEHKVLGTRTSFRKLNVKYVSRWDKISPNKFIHRESLDPEEYIEYFKIPFMHTEDYIEPLSFCLALCTMSSPVIGSNGKGGIDSAVLTAKKKHWNEFKRLMQVIPPDFKKTKSEYYFNQLDTEKKLNPSRSKEVNLSVSNPKELSVHVPMALVEEIEFKKPLQYKETLYYEAPLMRAKMLDALLFEPEISEKTNKHVRDKIYEVRDAFVAANAVNYSQDIGTTPSKISSAFARLKFKDKVAPEYVDECVDLWMDMFHYSSRIDIPNLSRSGKDKLSAEAQRAYDELKDTFGTRVSFSIAEVPKHVTIDHWLIEYAIDELKRKGAAYSPTNDVVEILDY
ncbi:hypothetical protein LI82_04160 [Methanococcoides methylutens]|uniref:Uncharacterized protein n=1 Tax=Methanococcoides methylutens TaxID=2226 RepID=A0A099T289_METMT|nr:hypothetical protein [Methanococcoides methylutens]KGK99222.1 hypothetical protein LI82_04160 [Methanococcoides methylutens]